MEPAEIKAALQFRNPTTTQVAIAQHCQVTTRTVHDVIYGKRRCGSVEACIAKLLCRNREEIWPQWFTRTDEIKAKQRLAFSLSTEADAIRARLSRELCAKSMSHLSVANTTGATLSEVESWFNSTALPSLVDLLALAYWVGLDLGKVITGVSSKTERERYVEKHAGSIINVLMSGR